MESVHCYGNTFRLAHTPKVGDLDPDAAPAGARFSSTVPFVALRRHFDSMIQAMGQAFGSLG